MWEGEILTADIYDNTSVMALNVIETSVLDDQITRINEGGRA